MTREEVCKYIGEVALSGATDFMQKYEQAGDGATLATLAWVSTPAFMVAGRVTVDSLSYQPGAEADPLVQRRRAEYTVEPSDKSGRGTVIIPGRGRRQFGIFDNRAGARDHREVLWIPAGAHLSGGFG